MAKVKKICRICGKEYTPCGYCENDKMAFHYRAFCCSRECAQVYLARVLEARQQDFNNIKEKDNEISFLKSKISSLKNTIEYWKDKFDKLISFLYSKLHNWYDKDDKYIDVVNDMYEDNVLDDDDIKELKLSKEKDDFER